MELSHPEAALDGRREERITGRSFFRERYTELTIQASRRGDGLHSHITCMYDLFPFSFIRRKRVGIIDVGDQRRYYSIC